MAGNANFDGAAAYNVARIMSQRWSAIWRPAMPLYAMVKGKKLRYNNAARDTTGLKMILPITYQGPSTTTRAATTANQFTAITPYARQGFTQAEYYYATYENALYLNIQDVEQLVAGSTQLIPVIPGAVEQLMMQFVKDINADMVGTQNGTGRGGTGQLTGEQYILSTSNSPGNISQVTYSVWQAGVTAANQPFNEGLISTEFDRIHDQGRGDADFVQLSYTSSNNVYGKLRNVIGTAQIVENPNAPAHYGFKTFMYLDMECFMDGRLGDSLAGSFVVGNSASWWLNQDTEEPKQVSKGNTGVGPQGTERILGTSSYEMFFTHTLSVGNNDPALNSLVTGVQ